MIEIELLHRRIVCQILVTGIQFFGKQRSLIFSQVIINLNIDISRNPQKYFQLKL